MLFKVLTIAIVIFIVYIMFFKQSRDEVVKESKNKRANKPKSDEEILMECVKCGTFTSQDDAIIKDGKFFCSKECAGVK